MLLAVLKQICFKALDIVWLRWSFIRFEVPMCWSLAILADKLI